jgi:hypothetical protein
MLQSVPRFLASSRQLLELELEELRAGGGALALELEELELEELLKLNKSTRSCWESFFAAASIFDLTAHWS